MAQVTGYKDYARVAAQAGEVLFNQKAVVSSFPSSGLLDSNGFGYLNLTFNALAVPDIFGVQVKFFADVAMTTLLNTTQVLPTGLKVGTYQVPVVGRYFTVTVQWLSGPGTATLGIQVFGANNDAPRPSTPNPAKPVMYLNTFLTAGASITVNGGAMFEGFATLSFLIGTGNGWSVQMQYMDDISLTFQTYQYFIGLAYGQGTTQQIKMPPTPVQAIVTNTGASTQQVWFSLVG